MRRAVMILCLLQTDLCVCTVWWNSEVGLALRRNNTLGREPRERGWAWLLISAMEAHISIIIFLSTSPVGGSLLALSVTRHVPLVPKTICHLGLLLFSESFQRAADVNTTPPDGEGNSLSWSPISTRANTLKSSGGPLVNQNCGPALENLHPQAQGNEYLAKKWVSQWGLMYHAEHRFM